MAILNHIITLLLVVSVSSYMVGVDFNTFSAAELNDAVRYFGHVDFTWAITINSPGVSAQQWSAAFAGTNKNVVFS
jgi:hypothetical protein